MSKKAAQSFFGANAAAYANSNVHARGRSLQRLVELVEPQPAWKALDVATGAGHTAFVFAPHVAHVTATDITPEMLSAAADLALNKSIVNVAFAEADAEALPYDDGCFDLVTCRIAAHHFPHVNRFVRESYRVLRDGGILAVVDNVSPQDQETAAQYNRFEKDRDKSHCRCLSVSEWQTAFEHQGFAIQAVETLDQELDFAFWVDRFQIRDEVKSELRDRLLDATNRLAEFLRPVSDEDGLRFYLTEAIIVGRK